MTVNYYHHYYLVIIFIIISSVQSLSHVQLFVTP